MSPAFRPAKHGALARVAAPRVGVALPRVGAAAALMCLALPWTLRAQGQVWAPGSAAGMPIGVSAAIPSVPWLPLLGPQSAELRGLALAAPAGPLAPSFAMARPRVGSAIERAPVVGPAGEARRSVRVSAIARSVSEVHGTLRAPSAESAYAAAWRVSELLASAAVGRQVGTAEPEDFAGGTAGSGGGYEDIERALDGGEPSRARRLLADPGVMSLARAGRPEAAALLSRAAALADLSLQLDAGRDGGRLREALLARAADSTLARAGIGSSPRALLAWAAAHEPGRLAPLRVALRTWDTLSLRQRGALAALGEDERRWDARSLDDRRRLLSEWAEGAYARLMGLDADVDDETLSAVRAEAKDAFHDLQVAEQARLQRRLDAIDLLAQTRARLLELEAAGQDPKRPSVSEQMFALADRSVESQLSFLRRALAGVPRFSSDESLVRLGELLEAPGAALSEERSVSLAAALEEHLLSEAAGTRAGDRVLAFYRGEEPLHLAVRRMPGAAGQFRAATREVALSEDYILAWLRGRGLGQDALSSAEVLRSLVRRILPVFVHEATHQMQRAAAERAGRPVVFTQESEIEAFSMEGLLIVEKSARDPAFLAELDQDERDLAGRFREDLDGFGRIVRSIYPALRSVDSFGSVLLGAAAAMSRELARRLALSEERRRAVEAAAWPHDIGWALARGADVSFDVPGMTSPELRRWTGRLLDWLADAAAEASRARAWVEETLRSLRGGIGTAAEPRVSKTARP